MRGFVILFFGGAGASVFLWPEHLFLTVLFLAPKPSTLVWHFRLYTDLMSIRQTYNAVFRAVVFEGSFWSFGGWA